MCRNKVMVPVTVRSLEFKLSVVQDGASKVRWFKKVAEEERRDE
jgi:hypothetical protein